MQINLYTILWAILALVSIFGTYYFNKGRSFLTFITAKKYLLILLLASLFGMRQQYETALILLALAVFLMYRDYKPYVETCRRLKRAQDQTIEH